MSVPVISHTRSAPPSIALAWGLWRAAWKKTYGIDCEPYSTPFPRRFDLGRPEPTYYASIDALSDELNTSTENK